MFRLAARAAAFADFDSREVTGVRMWQQCSIRVRLTVVASVIMALLCTAVAVFTLVEVRNAAVEHREDQLIAQAVETARQMRHRGVSSTSLPDRSDEAVQVFDPAGTLVVATPELVGKPPMVNLPSDVDAYAAARSCDLQAFPDQCKIVVVYPFHMADGIWRLDMAVADVPWHVNPVLLGALVAGWLLLVGATTAGTYRTVGKTLAPVSAITGKLSQITASDLGHRVPVPKYQDELRELAETANRTLERAQTAVEQQLRFASDASHDLRSPLTAMRVEIEEALLHPEQTDLLATGNALLGSVERLQDLVTDLLQIARLDAGISGQHELIDLTALVAGELDRRPHRAAVVRELIPAVTVRGERIGLTRLLNNLLDNAERHADSTITVTVASERGTAVLEVIDDGEGIAPEQREAVFQRFTRLEASREKDIGGTGLGLPIARQLAETHGGTLTLQGSSRGARFILRLPLAPANRPIAR